MLESFPHERADSRGVRGFNKPGRRNVLVCVSVHLSLSSWRKGLMSEDGLREDKLGLHHVCCSSAWLLLASSHLLPHNPGRWRCPVWPRPTSPCRIAQTITPSQKNKAVLQQISEGNSRRKYNPHLQKCKLRWKQLPGTKRIKHDAAMQY